MGYRREPKMYRLQFEDPEFDGLEVMVRSLPVGEFLALGRLQGAIDKDDPDINEVEKLFKVFADKLVGWNLEDQAGTKVAANLNGLKSQDLDFVLAIIGAWVNAMGGVSPELGKGSTSGANSLVAGIPTEALSPSLQS
jgi:hypothetical protein